MSEITLITRRERIAQTIKSFQNLGPYDDFTSVYEAFVTVFDRVELSAIDTNRKDRTGSAETIYMTLPPPHEHKTLIGLYYSVMTKHLIIFTEWGALALYRKIINSEIEVRIEDYKNNPLCQPLLELPGACGKKVWVD